MKLKRIAMKGAKDDPMNGRRATFRYSTQFSDDLLDYRKHSGQEVVILRRLREDEQDKDSGPNFYVEASDGWIGNAHRCELTIHRP